MSSRHANLSDDRRPYRKKTGSNLRVAILPSAHEQRLYRQRLLLLVAFLVSALLCGSLRTAEPVFETSEAAPQERQPSASALTHSILENVKSTPVEEVWSHVSRLIRLGREFGSTVTVPLAKVLNDDDEKMKLVAARTLCQLDALESSAPVLRELLLTAKDAAIRRLAANTIGLIPRLYDDTQTPPALQSALEQEKDAPTRISIARTLWRIGLRTDGKQALVELMRQAEASAVRNEAALVLADFGMLVPMNTWEGDADDEVKQEVYTHILNLSLEPTAQGERAFNLYRHLERRPLENDEKVAHGMRLLREILFQIQTAYPDQQKIDMDRLSERAGKGMVEALDPFSQYMDRQEVCETRDMLRQDYGGIGAYVALQDRTFQLISPIYSSPAYDAGLRAMDTILQVNGEDTERMIDQGGMARMIARLKGSPGTDVSITFTRRGFLKPVEVIITRAIIGVDSVLYEVLPGNIGYTRIRRFGERTPEELERAINQMRQKHDVRGLVLDLRDNPGGLLRGGVEVADRFLAANKLITYSMGRPTSAPRRDYFSTGDASDESFPLVVLINQGSASASEIVAGALKDHKRANLIGERTYGKGSVQQIIPVQATHNETQLRLTIAKYYLPSGSCIHGTGIAPDIESSPKPQDDWVLRQLQKIRRGYVIEDYVRKFWSEQQALLIKIAEDGDHDRTDVYPGFQQLRALLEAYKLDEDVIRAEVRRVIRRLAQDHRGREYGCDLQSDETLQRGVFDLLVKLQIDPSGVVQYEGYPKKFQKHTTPNSSLGAFIKE